MNRSMITQLVEQLHRSSVQLMSMVQEPSKFEHGDVVRALAIATTTLDWVQEEANRAAMSIEEYDEIMRCMESCLVRVRTLRSRMAVVGWPRYQGGSN